MEEGKRGWETAKKEYSYWVPKADIEGRIPDELQGTFFRNGPGLNEVYGKKLKHRKYLYESLRNTNTKEGTGKNLLQQNGRKSRLKVSYSWPIILTYD